VATSHSPKRFPNQNDGIINHDILANVLEMKKMMEAMQREQTEAKNTLSFISEEYDSISQG